MLVFEQDSPFQRRADRRRRFGGPFGHPYWRYAQLVAGLDTVVGLGPSPVDPHLAAAQDAINVALGHAFKQLDQIVVDTLPAGLFPDLVPRHRIFAQILHFAYTIHRLADLDM